MPQTSVRQLAIYAALLVLVALVGSRWLAQERPDEPEASAPVPVQIADHDGGRLTVHVAGAVRNPGVYRLSGRARTHDAVRRAGGPTRSADLTQVNLAAKLEDGRQILLPELPAEGLAVAAGTGAANAAGASPPGVPLNLNTATVEQLDELDGIGPATAQQILDYRQANNGFGSVEELGEVPGIGDKRLSSLREQVRV